MTPEDLKQIVELVEGLSTEMQSGFAEVTQHFAEVRQQFAGVNDRLDRMDTRLARMDRTVSVGARQVTNLTEWSEKQDQFQSDTHRRLDSLEERIKKLERQNGTKSSS